MPPLIYIACYMPIYLGTLVCTLKLQCTSKLQIEIIAGLSGVSKPASFHRCVKYCALLAYYAFRLASRRHHAANATMLAAHRASKGK
jgi:hypothetical protein